MANAKVVHSQDAVMVEFKGNPKSPEPSTGVIKFPGGHVEVTRTSDGSYWAHLTVVDPQNIVDSRMDITESVSAVRDLPNGDKVKSLAIRVANNIPHFNPDA